MRRSLSLAFPLAVTLLFACGRSSSSRAHGEIAVTPTAIDFGKHAPGDHADVVLTIHNNGTPALSINGMSISGDARNAFRLGQAPTQIAGGAQAAVTVSYDAPATPGADGASLEIDSDADNAPTLLVALAAQDQSPCAAGFALCSGVCVDTQRDPGNCGACAHPCSAGQICSSGGCGACTANAQCPSRQACLSGACGPCSTATQCGTGQACIGGACGPCASSTQCPSGQVCTNGTCGPCTNSGQCLTGQVCVSGACGPCASTSQCASGQVCVSGACGPCTMSSQCPSGQVCSGGACGPCTTSGQCAAGQACVGGACGPCTANSQCTAGQACISGACGPCTANAQCGTGQACISGACGPCATNAQCAAGQACVAGVCGPCTVNSQCAAGQACISGACGPCASSSQCGPGQACVSGTCGPCTANSQCAAGQACVSGACGPCSVDPQCDPGQACFSGTCGPCTADACTMKGLIVGWTGRLASIPAGYVLADGDAGTPDLRGLFVKGGTQAGLLGGALMHTHDAGTDVTTFVTGDAGTDVCPVINSAFCSWIAVPTDHTHAFNSQHALNAASNLPPYYEVAYLVKQSTSLVPPDGIVVAWATPSSPPAGWLPLDGIVMNPDLRGRFLKGAAPGVDPGGTGGSSTHDHGGMTAVDSSPSSVWGAGLKNFAGNCGPGCATGSEFGHSHTYLHAHTVAAANNEPVYFSSTFLSASSAAWYPPGAIAMWNGLSSALPRGWVLCDGTNGTPNLTASFLKAATTSSPPGATGGAATHTHVIGMDPGGTSSLAPATNSPSGSTAGQMVHTHQIPPHTHSLAADANDPPYYQVVFIQRQ